MIKNEYESWVQCFAWTEQEKVTWLLDAAKNVEQEIERLTARVGELEGALKRYEDPQPICDLRKTGDYDTTECRTEASTITQRAGGA